MPLSKSYDRAWNWKKLGIVVEPSPEISWLSHYAGPTFAVSDGTLVKLFVTGRDSNNVSRIGVVRLELDNSDIIGCEISPVPVFDVGRIGTFDESGVSYPWIVEHNNRHFMFYVGWVNGGLARFQNNTGLAISTDNCQTFSRVSEAPILERTKLEPFGTGSCCVWCDSEKWKMIYTSFEPWSAEPNRAKPSYNLKEATSDDGVTWTRTGQIIVDFSSSTEYIVGKPSILIDSGYHLWYSYRGDTYRIGYGNSSDGTHFTRHDNLVGITTSPSGWDSEMVEYAFVFDHQGNRFMVYNGNQFGKTGLGLAVLSD